MARASARHILVPEEADCNTLKNLIEGGEDFAEIAGVELLVIDAETSLAQFKKELRSNEVYYSRSGGL